MIIARRTYHILKRDSDVPDSRAVHVKVLLPKSRSATVLNGGIVRLEEELHIIDEAEKLRLEFDIDCATKQNTAKVPEKPL